MLKLLLKTPAYQYLEIAFKEWLDVLGYGSQSIYNMPHIIREFLHYLENNQLTNIHSLQQKHIKAYYHYLTLRENARVGGALSNNYINKHLQAIEKFLEYLHHKGLEHVPTLGIQYEKLYREAITVLTTDEVKELFALTMREVTDSKSEIIQARDRAILVVYYSLGLRRNEGVHLGVDDINFDTRIVHVRKGKNYKERFVPLNKINADYLQTWIYDYRNALVKDKKEHRLFIGMHGEPTTGGTLYTRLKLLQLQSDNIALQQKNIGLHSLRHSIATHLLNAGMSLEKIAKFLGHSSLESTQIYTHLVETIR